MGLGLSEYRGAMERLLNLVRADALIRFKDSARSKLELEHSGASGCLGALVVERTVILMSDSGLSPMRL